MVVSRGEDRRVEGGGSGGNGGDEKTGRKLRSKDVIPRSKQTLFNFDNVNRVLYQDQAIIIDQGTDFDNFYRYNQDIQLPAPKLINNLTKSSIFDYATRKLPIKDGLTDEIYENFHKKMKKEEKLMANEDKLRILSEVDNLQNQLSLLKQYDWVRHLPNICHINDFQDFDELELKKQLTIYEIEKLLKKYESWKRRSEQLVNDIKNPIIDIIPPQKEYDLSLDQIKLNRKKQIRNKYGPIIKLKLNNGFILVIDPILPPKIIKSDNGIDIKVYKSQFKYPESPPVKVKKSFKPRKHYKTKSKSISITKLVDVESVDLMTNHNGEMIFGTRIVDLKVPQDGFQLPKLMRKESLNNEQERISFRKSLD